MYLCGDETLGWIVGESMPERSIAILDKSSYKHVRAGSYVTAQGAEGCILGIVERLVAGSRLYPGDVTSPEVVNSVISSLGENGGEYYLRAYIRWLSTVDALRNGMVMSPKYPPLPGSPISSVSRDVLETVFSPKEKSWVRIGVLEPSGIEYRVNANKLSRHLAILAVTGGGKSNTVCILARRLVDGLNATIALFDMHGEYGDLGLKGKSVVWSPASVNPASLSFPELLQLVRMPPNAINQERILRWAWRNALEHYREQRIRAGEILWLARKLIEWLLESKHKVTSSAKGSKVTIKLGEEGYSVSMPPRDVKPEQIHGVLNKLDDLKDYYSDVLNPNLPLSLDMIVKPGHLTVFDLSSLDEQGADAVTSHYIRRILQERKKAKGNAASGYPTPLIVVIEEAHVLVPSNDETLTKYWAARIAREGRKFGIGLTLVSQRPKNLDPDVLSQTNNKIILRMVEPQDIRYVQAASEELSDDLTSLLPSLNPGEAVVIGSITRLPALVKIDRCTYKYGGGDIDLVGEWSREAAGRNAVKEVF